MNTNIKIGVIIGRKKTDALLCKTLEKHFKNVVIAQHQIPPQKWFSWVLRRLRNMGLLVLFGHLSLACYLRLERIKEKMSGTSKWLTYTTKIPSWEDLRSKKVICFSEKKLLKVLSDVDVIIILDSFRVSHQFYRKIKTPCLQVIWGMVPDFLGDSAGFWAYALEKNDQVGITVAERSHQFNKLQIIYEKKIVCREKEDLRTIKIKQVIGINETLPSIITNFIQSQDTTRKNNAVEKECSIFQAPTLETYLKFLKSGTVTRLPSYACTKNKFYITYPYDRP